MSELDFNAAQIETIADLKARVDIVDIIGRYATLKKRGPDWWCCCPLHADGTPSLKVNPSAAAVPLLRLPCQGRRARLPRAGRKAWTRGRQ